MKVQILNKNKAVMTVRGKHFPTCMIHDFTVTDIFLYQIRHSGQYMMKFSYIFISRKQLRDHFCLLK
jgi:hypothetical protein